ncbi:MAG: ABC transporter ATP-binding protein [Lentisphaerae bacterium]|jgi:ABC-2 type transport system ATP-binding protein|nr:ABC transporter ATP-binding protein [Lentisphaerota bacterium]
MLEVRNVEKRYAGRLALRDVSLEVPAGEVHVVVGPNGAGKSTLLGIVAGVIRPGAGQVLIGGVDIFGARAPTVRRHMAFLPENCPLYNDLRVEEHLTYRGKLKGLSGKRLRARMRSVMENCSLESFRRQLIGRLSLGERMRVGLADALMTEPRLLVLDEPFAGLDPEQAGHICALLAGYGRHGTVLLATHRLEAAERLGPRCSALYRGRLAATLDTQSAAAPLAERLHDLWRACAAEEEAT